MTEHTPVSIDAILRRALRSSTKTVGVMVAPEELAALQTKLERCREALERIKFVEEPDSEIHKIARQALSDTE